MRNLKKFLALVLAMMMALSLMVTVNAAAGDPVTDLETVTDEFQEAVQVLNGLGIITGYENGEFRPLKNITRAETTALVYRLHSGDAQNVKNNLYSTADNIAKFKDVNPNGGDQWSAGYIGYCANQEIIKGVSADRFNPNGNVTGYQVLAMVLRAIGYGQNGEYEGTGWQTRVATTATKLGLLKNVDDTNYAGTLSAAATRELVAEIVFQAALEPTVTYTPAYGYEAYGGKCLATLNFDLDYSAYTTVDEWGRPGYYWFQDTKHNGTPVPSGSGKNVVATITPKAEQTYTTVTDECDLARDLDIPKNATFELYLNDKDPVTTAYRVEATDTVTKVGGQGRLTEVYRDLKNDKMSTALTDRVVMIDTFLAQVTSVSPAVKDAGGHVIIQSEMTLAIYDQAQAANSTTPNPSSPRTVKKTDGTDWEYVKGDMILLNAWTDHDGDVDAANDVDLHTADVTAANRAAFEPERVELVGGALLNGDVTTEVNYAEVIGLAKSTVAQQSVVYWNQEKHNVDGADYNNNLCLFLDVLGTATGTDATWYFDQYGNVIGIGEATRSSYGVITSIYSSFSTANGATNGEAVARAHVKFADGTEGDITIDRFLVSVTGTKGSENVDDGHATANSQMTVGINTADLTPVYDYNATGDVMTAEAGSNNSSDAVKDGDLLVAPVASINANVENGQNGSGYFGIIEGNLFKFVASGDGKMTAIEVAGHTADANDSTNTTGPNTGLYQGHFNAEVAVGSSADTQLKKNVGFLTVIDETNKSPLDSGITLRLNNSTQIILKEGDNINVYNGLSDLGGDVTIADSAEVDWVDYDGDGIVDVLYAPATVTGNITHSLFYYVGGAGQWDGANKKGTLFGYIDGVEGTLDFDNQAEFNLVRNSTEYGGRLFAVEITGGTVTNLMGQDVTNFKHDILANGSSATMAADGTEKTLTALKLNNGVSSSGISGFGSDTFKDKDNGGSYPTATKAIWYVDDHGATTEVTYDSAKGTITVSGVSTPYYLNDQSKVLGDSLFYLNRMDRDNNVTIVYDTVDSIKVILQIYVDTKADVTSGETPTGNATISSSVPKAPTGLTDGNALAAWLKTHKDGVYQCTDKVTGTNYAGPGNMLYFPFITSVNNTVATLEIRRDGVLMFTETDTIATAGGHFFSFDFLNAPDNSTASWSAGCKPLTAGVYTYQIILNGTTVYTSGTFTLD